MTQIKKSNLLRLSVIYSLISIGVECIFVVLLHFVPLNSFYLTLQSICGIFLLFSASGGLFLLVLALVRIILLKMSFFNAIKIVSTIIPALMGIIVLILVLRNIATTIQLTLTNATGVKISNVVINASEKINYNDLEPNQSKTKRFF